MLFTRLGSPQSISSTQLSADRAYSALWHLLITHWQIPNRIFTDCQYAALQAQEVIWINHACTHARNKVQTSKSQGHSTSQFPWIPEGLVDDSGMWPIHSQGRNMLDSCCIHCSTATDFFPRTNCFVPSRTNRGWSLADPHHKFHLTEKP